MRHEYDDEQIFESNKIAARTTGRDWISRFNLRDVRAILDALPEPATDDWEECGANDLQSGDVYRAESPDANIAYKKPIEKCAIVGDWLEVQHVGGMKSSAKISTNTFYRIPAPVTHPDPAEHPIIMEQGGKGWVWNAQHEMYYQPHSTEYRFPEGFTEWSPAQINSDEPAEAPR